MRYSQKQANQQYLLIIKEVFRNIAMYVEDAPMQFLLLLPLDRSLDGETDLIKEGVQSLL
jgi:hypothetical protein